MYAPLLIMNVQVFSLDMAARYLTSIEAILKYDHHIEIKIPLSSAHPVNNGPIVGERYFVQYQDGIAKEISPPEFRYMGMRDNHLIFSSVAMQPA